MGYYCHIRRFEEEAKMEVIIKSIPLYYEEFGTGIPIVMLHGWPGDHRPMVARMEPLFQHRTGWRRIYPDLPGMGKTPGASWITHQEHMLEIVVAFLQQVTPGQRYVVVGESYGGYLARGLVHEQEAMLDGVFLMVPDVETDRTKQHLPPQQVLVEDPQFLSALRPEEAELLTKMVVVQSAERLSFIRTFIQPAFAAADHAFLERLEEHYAFSFPVDQLATPFPGPTLILTGRQDSNCGYREAWTLLDNYPRGTFAVLDRAGHALGGEQEGLFHALAQEWLERVEEYIAQTTR
jgi:pimeloyl-ACP methyl ester carboxylesterase